MYVFGSGRSGSRGGEWMRGLGLGFTILWEQGECWTYVCFGCGGVGGEWVGGLDQGLEGWCYVCVRCESGVDGRSRYLCIVLGGYLRI